MSNGGVRNGNAAKGDALSVVIPIGGVGSRFAKEGYRFPKPLINIAGRAMLFWIIDRLELTENDSLFIAISDMVNDEFHLDSQLRREYPHLNVKLIPLRFDTRGAAETLFIVAQSMTDDELQRRTVSLDCDTIYFPEARLLSRIRTLPPHHGATVVFDDAGDPPVFSYVETDSRNRIVDIKEKIAISRHANTGAYVFPDGFSLRQRCAAFLDQPLKSLALGEYYTSSLIADMIGAGFTFVALPIPNSSFACVGTPPQLNEFLKTISQKQDLVKPFSSLTQATQRRRFCWDLDSLVTPPCVFGDYRTVKPIRRNIELVRQLHAAGHCIIISTSRGMQQHDGNVNAAVADNAAVTLATLAKLEIPYDEIQFGKPYAHCYVDSRAVNSLLDTQKEIGWYAASGASRWSGKGSTGGMLVPRSFNAVQVIENAVVKSSTSEAILGEIYFFSRIPTDIKDVFPAINTLNFVPSTQSFSLTMQRVHGVTFSHLLVGRALTVGRLEKFLAALSRIHSSNGIVDDHISVPPSLAARLNALGESPNRNVDIYANYAAKVSERYKAFLPVYQDLGDDHEAIASRLLAFLQDFEADDRAQASHVIHGDPVFSNALFTKDNTVVFIDVRGRQGDVLTLRGDALYDLAKVYQSLQGYDFALLADPISAQTAELVDLVSPVDRRLLQDLQGVFWAFVKKHYTVDRRDLILVTASLLFSLIPLHDPPMRRLFYKMCKAVMAQVRKG
ncbi:Nucleotide-diphospho-sugar transferase [Rhodotorula toruloides]|uniref:Nucleotide-diphospho-sugar transferase n=1 Tax=Rhodotorula toruloides TaxID=5286 RepID=A0A2S9ZYM5_RHOTO|nr:Nucleotide-diphospho-sugar transferase [Rhodotorula toruloides]